MEKQQDERPLQVIAFQVGTYTELGAALIRFDYPASPMERTEQAHRGHWFCLAQAQLRDLKQQIDEALRRLDTAPLKGAPPGSH